MEILKIRLKEERELNGFTQKQFAIDLGIPLSTYKNYESKGKGGRLPDLEMLVKIAKILNTTTDYLLGRE